LYSTDGHLDPSHKVRKQYDGVRVTIAEREKEVALKCRVWQKDGDKDKLINLIIYALHGILFGPHSGAVG